MASIFFFSGVCLYKFVTYIKNKIPLYFNVRDVHEKYFNKKKNLNPRRPSGPSCEKEGQGNFTSLKKTIWVPTWPKVKEHKGKGFVVAVF